MAFEAPTFDQFVDTVRGYHPDATEAQVRAAYTKRFSATPVRSDGPDLTSFAQTVRGYHPDASDAQVQQAYDARYGASLGTSFARGAKSAFAGAGKFGGALVGGLGRIVGSDSLDTQGQSIFDYYQNLEDRNAPARAIQGNVIDNPALLGKGGFWASKLGGTVAGLPTGIIAGPGTAAAQTYTDTGGDIAKTAAVGLPTAALNVLPFGQGLGRIWTGALMAAANTAPAALQAAVTGQSVPEALKEAAGDLPTSFLMGAALPQGKGAAMRETRGARAQFEDRLAGLAPEPEPPVQAQAEAPVGPMTGSPPVEPPIAPDANAEIPDVAASPPTDLPASSTPPDAAAGAAPATNEPDPFAPSASLSLTERLARDPALSQALDAMRNETGWVERGGRLLRGQNDEVIGRTSWVPREDWWLDRPGHRDGSGLSEEEVHTAIDKAIAGERLGPRQQATVEHMLDVIDSRRATSAYLPAPEEFAAAAPDAAHNDEHAMQTALTARAAEIDEGAVERLAKQYEDDPDGYLSAVQRFVQTHDAGANAGRGEAGARTQEPGIPSARDGDRLGTEAPAAQTLEARTRAYRTAEPNDKQASFDFETRPNTEPKQVELGRSALRDLLRDNDRRGGASVLGNAIPRDFVEHGRISLVGQVARDSHDLANLAQVYRDPRYETMRFFLVDKAGRIVHHYGITARMPGVVSFSLEDSVVPDLKTAMKVHGADGYYVLHNHPSGDPSPSAPDVIATRNLSRMAPEFLGHVVIDHNRYAVIGKHGNHGITEKDFRGYDPGKNPRVAHDALYRRINSSNDLPRVGAYLQTREGFATLATVDAEGRVRSITELPESQLLNPENTLHGRALVRIKRLMEHTGGARTFAFVDSDEVAKRLFPLVRYGAITEAYSLKTGKSTGMSRSQPLWVDRYNGSFQKRNQTVEEQTRPYNMGRESSAPEQGSTAPEAPREGIKVGGGDYGLKQFGGLSTFEHRTLTSVMSDLEAPIAAQRRGTRTWNDTEKAALARISNKYGVTLDELVARKKGSTANAEQLESYALVLSQGSKELLAAAQDVAATDHPSADALAKVAALREKLGVLIAPAMGYQTEAGRALNILKKVAPTMKRADKLFEAMGDGSADAIQRFAKRLGDADNLDQVIGATRESYTPDWLDKLIEFRQSFGMLSGPSTHARNVAGNAIFSLMENSARVLAASVSKDYPLRAALARIGATGRGVTLGISNAAKAFMTEEAQVTAGTKLEGRRGAIGGTLGKIVRAPGYRALQAEDEFFKSVAFTQHLSDLAAREAVKNAPKDFAAEHARIMGDILNRPEMVEAAQKEADRLTFQDQLGRYAGFLSATTNHGAGRVLKLIVPWIKTPTNILKRATEYTPGAYAMPSVRATLAGKGADAAVAHARVAIGSGIGLTMLGLAANGMLSGAGPSPGSGNSSGERDLWLREGNQPYSIKVGDQWVKYNRFDPIGSIMGVTADMFEIGHAAQTHDLENIGAMLMTSIALNLGDKTFLQGITDFSNAYSDPSRYMQRWVEGLQTSFIPNLMAQYARESDPYQREARNLLDKIRSTIPGQREQLAARLDIAGQPTLKTGTGYGSPFETTAERNDPLAAAMLQSGVFKEKPPRDITLGGRTLKMEDADYHDYAAFIQQTRWKQLTPLAASPQFRQLMRANPVAAQSMLEGAWDKIGTAARTAYLYSHPKLIGKIASAPARVVTPSTYAEPIQ